MNSFWKLIPLHSLLTDPSNHVLSRKFGKVTIEHVQKIGSRKIFENKASANDVETPYFRHSPNRFVNTMAPNYVWPISHLTGF